MIISTDFSGERFGKIVVLERIDKKYWLCKCECGTVKPFNIYNLKDGKSKSCGCSKRNVECNTANLEGREFGSLTVVDRADSKDGRTWWNCRCVCGNTKPFRSKVLLDGKVKSCGCKRLEGFGGHNKTHGMSDTRLYGIWRGIKERTLSENNKMYQKYGAVGIGVCKEWADSFEAFRDWAIGSGYSDELTIDRIDNDKGYSPENCRWATPKEQSRNRKYVWRYTINGEEKTIVEWCEIYGLKPSTVKCRIRRGWDEKDWFLPPSTMKYKQRKQNEPQGSISLGV